MPTNHRCRALCFLCLALLLGATGCASGPAYVPPQLPPGELVTLKASNSAFVTHVDDHEVKGIPMSFLGAIGGNQTTASPGRHRLVVLTHNGNGSSTFTATLDLAPGHTYLFQSKDFGQRLTVTNQTTNRKWTLDRSTATAFDPDGKPHPAEQPFAP